MPAVKLYTLSTCPWCRRAKQFFTDHEVPYDVVDVDLLEGEEQDKVADEVFKLSGSLQYPVVVIDEQVVTGYNPSRYEAILGLSHASEVAP